MLNLQEIRLEKKLSISALSRLSGVSRPYITALEQGNYNATVSIVVKLCKALDVTPNDLIKKEYWG